MNQALRQYKQVGAVSGVQDADPHRLVQMMFQGLVDRLNAAHGCILNGNKAGQGENVGKSIRIVAGLRECLNFEGGDVARNLDALYDYIARRLVECNAHSDADGIEEIIRLVSPIKDAWDNIRPEVLSPKTASELHYSAAES